MPARLANSVLSPEILGVKVQVPRDEVSEVLSGGRKGTESPGVATRRHGHERIAIAPEPSFGAVHRAVLCPVAGSP